MVLDDIVTVYIPSVIITLVPGQNLFAGILPETDTDKSIPNLVVAINEYPGEPPLEVLAMSGSGAPAVEIPHLQLEVRSDPDDYLTARTLIEQVKNVLNGIANTVINGHRYQRVEALQSPFLLHRDDSRRSYFLCNFRVLRNPD